MCRVMRKRRRLRNRAWAEPPSLYAGYHIFSSSCHGTEYRDAEALQVVTIKNAVYVTMKNDLAFVLMGTLNMYEHQSTYSSNMPVRFLIYLAEEYQNIVEKAENSLYGTKLITLPTPQCVVFYNGEKEMPEEKVLRLSDAFENREKEADVELKVRMLNINRGHNEALMKNCGTLKEYAAFVDISRQYISEREDRNEALNMAVDHCIEEGILSSFLRKNRAEVLGMLLEEFDAEKYERTLREEGREEGREIGDAVRLVDSVRNVMMKSDVSLNEACELIGVTTEQYEVARRFVEK